MIRYVRGHSGLICYQHGCLLEPADSFPFCNPHLRLAHNSGRVDRRIQPAYQPRCKDLFQPEHFRFIRGIASVNPSKFPATASVPIVTSPNGSLVQSSKLFLVSPPFASSLESMVHYTESWTRSSSQRRCSRNYRNRSSLFIFWGTITLHLRGMVESPSSLLSFEDLKFTPFSTLSGVIQCSSSSYLYVSSILLF